MCIIFLDTDSTSTNVEKTGDTIIVFLYTWIWNRIYATFHIINLKTI